MIPEDITSRLKSRKFWVTVAVGVVVVFGDALGIDLSEAQVWQLASTAGAYLGIQGIIDYKNGG